MAIHNHFARRSVAETEFAERICKAACRLGWEAVTVGSSIEINQFAPDFVLALHFRTPKLTRFPTYGSMVTPPSFFAEDSGFVKNILSYDGYLFSSKQIRGWLRDILYTTHKTCLSAPWYTACQFVPYSPPQIAAPRLIYAGTNWDGSRFGELFARLDSEPYLDIYGPPAAWSHTKHSYRGTLPFDGVSILHALNKAGVGLCLHRKEHIDSATPSSRIFEIAASGAVAICQEHPFIRDAFQDSVLYLESTNDARHLSDQISEHMRWIRQNPDAALKLSRRAYDIFAQNYTLEKLLSDIVPCHQELLSSKKLKPGLSRKTLIEKSVQFIVRVGSRGVKYVQRALDSICCQSYPCVGAIIVQYHDVPDLSNIIKNYEEKLPIARVRSSFTGFRSSQLWDGLKAVTSEYFGVLDDDDVIYPNHVSSLLQLLDRSDDYGVAYSGAIRIWETDPASGVFAESPSEPADLAYFDAFDLGRLVAFDNFITTNAFLARSSLLAHLGDDPHLAALEDMFLLLFLARKTNFVFSHEATCEFVWRASKAGDSALLAQQSLARTRIADLLWKQNFPSAQRIGHASLSQLETRLAEVENMLNQTKVKADVTSARVNRYLNSPLFSAIRRLRRKLLRLPPPPPDA